MAKNGVVDPQPDKILDYLALEPALMAFEIIRSCNFLLGYSQKEALDYFICFESLVCLFFL